MISWYFCKSFIPAAFCLTILSSIHFTPLHFLKLIRRNQVAPSTLCLEIYSAKYFIPWPASSIFHKLLNHDLAKSFATLWQELLFLQFLISCHSFPSEISPEKPLISYLYQHYILEFFLHAPQNSSSLYPSPSPKALPTFLVTY